MTIPQTSADFSERTPIHRSLQVGTDGNTFNYLSIDPQGSILIRNLVWNPQTLAWEAATSGGGGGGSSPAAMAATWKISDMDTSSDPNYFGYLDGTGAWHIMQLGSASGQARYVKGPSDYMTNWTGRAALSYDLYSNVF